MKVTSQYLQKELDIPVNDLGYPEHSSLEDIVLNGIDPSLCFRYDLKIEAIEPHPVVLCTMQDTKGRRVQAVGEMSSEGTMTTIGKQYPVAMAANRAFDKAASLYLGIPDKISFKKAADANSGDAKPNASDDSQKAANAPSEPADKPSANTKGSSAKKQSNAKPEKSESSEASASAVPASHEEAPSAETSVSPAENTPEASEAANDAKPWEEIFGYGRYKGQGKTFAQVADEAPDYANWFIEKSSNRKVAEIFKAYLESKGGKADA